MVTGTTNGFLLWFGEWAQVIMYVGQLVFWLSLSAAALLAAFQVKRLVSFKVGAAVPAVAEADEVAGEPVIVVD